MRLTICIHFTELKRFLMHHMDDARNTATDLKGVLECNNHCSHIYIYIFFFNDKKKSSFYSLEEQRGW